MIKEHIPFDKQQVFRNSLHVQTSLGNEFIIQLNEIFSILQLQLPRCATTQPPTLICYEQLQHLTPISIPLALPAFQLADDKQLPLILPYNQAAARRCLPTTYLHMKVYPVKVVEMLLRYTLFCATYVTLSKIHAIYTKLI